ncbi:hypothetical protein [Arthrobacter antibioticus]|uniref:hypothetical protein n=1 Tax=Arthrobacter sp. H35-MC1 TaxID=3046203 RepID=UPI0024B97DF0|nr:hypothetical protein [Arthrobacter sp. H35-MC1]
MSFGFQQLKPVPEPEPSMSFLLSMVIAVVTLIIAWMTFKVSKESRIVAEQGHRTSQESLQVASNGWKQVGREEPWSLTKLDKNN